MKKVDVYSAIETEREFQDYHEEKGGTHIVEDFPLGSALTAIKVKLDVATSTWYNDTAPHEATMAELRKIAAICVKMGEKYGMPERSNFMV